MKQMYLNTYYHLFAEFILAFLLFQPIFALIDVNNENLYYVIAFLCSMVFVFIVSKRPSLFKLTLISFILLVILIGVLFGLNVVVLILLIGYCFYRSRVVIVNELEDYSHSILFYTFCAGLFVICFNLLIKIDDVKDISFITAGVFILQMIYCIVIGYFKKLISHNIKENRSKYLMPLAGIVMALIASIGSIYLLRDVFYRIFFGIVDVIFSLLEGILTPLLKLINIEFEPRDQTINPYEIGFGEGEHEPTTETNESFLFIIMAIIIGIVVAIASYILYRYLKEKKKEYFIQNEAPIYESTVRDLMGGMSIFSKNKIPEPENKIRKEVYYLEKYAYKKGVERNQGETMRQWFERLDIQMPDLFFNYYDKVRYGNQLIDSSEQIKFLAYSKIAKDALKQKIKEMRKK